MKKQFLAVAAVAALALAFAAPADAKTKSKGYASVSITAAASDPSYNYQPSVVGSGESVAKVKGYNGSATALTEVDGKASLKTDWDFSSAKASIDAGTTSSACVGSRCK